MERDRFDAAERRKTGAKMKMKVDLIVPLSTQALDILKKLEPMTDHATYVLTSISTDDRCMSENTVSATLRSMGYAKEEMTAHGFRGIARTILDEVLGERVDLLEHQLAHAVIGPNGRAYNRTAHLPARKPLCSDGQTILTTFVIHRNLVRDTFRHTADQSPPQVKRFQSPKKFCMLKSPSQPVAFLYISFYATSQQHLAGSVPNRPLSRDRTF